MRCMTFPAAVPEITAAYYVHKLGLDWGDEQGGIAGISRGNCRLFIANQRAQLFADSGPGSTWIDRVKCPAVRVSRRIRTRKTNSLR
jgi:hypothetical protein